MLNPTPSLPPPLDAIELLIPTTSPFMLTSGPPELPGLIAASVWMKSWLTTSGSSSICRPRALMIPWLTECRQAKRASQRHHPGSDRGLVAIAQTGRRQIVAVELEDGDVGLGVGPDLHRQDRPAVAQEDADLGWLRAVDHVMIGQNEKAGGAVAADDDARTGFLELPDAAVLLGTVVFWRRCEPPTARPPWPPARTSGSPAGTVRTVSPGRHKSRRRRLSGEPRLAELVRCRRVRHDPAPAT